MPGLIPESLVKDAITILEKLNRGYWSSLYWEFQDDADTLYVQINIDQRHNRPENILAISNILRSVLAPLIPSKDHELSWCGSIDYHGQSVGGAIGGWRDDWKTLGIDASERSPREKAPHRRDS